MGQTILSDIVSIQSDVMSGLPVFRGTRVLIDTVIVELAAGTSLDDILADHPSLDRKDVLLFLSELSQFAQPQKAA
jgi:uncharacterized protein (DUF433 family)